MNESITNAFTVDVEDYFQVSAFERAVAREQWGRQQYRVEQNTDRLLSVFDEYGVKVTFFVLGWVAERSPSLIRKMVDMGHELASHGYEHTRVTNQDRHSFREDVIKTKGILEDLSGQVVKGYRAASYSINRQNLWAHDILQETGHIYSSSIYPIRHDLYGIPDAPRFSSRYSEKGIVEIPVTTVRILGKNYPSGGGGFFRLFPYPLSRYLIRCVNGNDKKPAIFYCHPWEIDPEQPRQANISAKTRFRHYLNLHKTESRIRRLLVDFNWGRMDQVFLKDIQE